LFIALYLYQVEYLYIVKTASTLRNALDQALLNSGTSATRISQLTKISSLTNLQMGEKGEEGLDREAILKKRKEAIANIQKCVAQYE
jgi:hypothetical protein